MAQYTVLCYESGAESIGIFVEEAVVAYAKAYNSLRSVFSSFKSFACSMGLHMFFPTSSQAFGMSMVDFG